MHSPADRSSVPSAGDLPPYSVPRGTTTSTSAAPTPKRPFVARKRLLSAPPPSTIPSVETTTTNHSVAAPAVSSAQPYFGEHRVGSEMTVDEQPQDFAAVSLPRSLVPATAMAVTSKNTNRMTAVSSDDAATPAQPSLDASEMAVIPPPLPPPRPARPPSIAIQKEAPSPEMVQATLAAASSAKSASSVSPGSPRQPPPRRQSSLANNVKMNKKPKDTIILELSGAADPENAPSGSQEPVAASKPKWRWFKPASSSSSPSSSAAMKAQALRRSTTLHENWKARSSSNSNSMEFDLSKSRLSMKTALPASDPASRLAVVTKTPATSKSLPASSGSSPRIAVNAPASSPTPSPSTVTISKEKIRKMVEVRKYILHEVLTTEKNYVRNLQDVMEKYRDPLIRAALGEKAHRSLSRHSSGATFSSSPTFPGTPGFAATAKGTIIPMIGVKIIFAYIEELWEFNSAFAVELEEVVNNWTISEAVWESQQEGTAPPVSDFEPLSIGKLFLNHVGDWNVYLRFVDNYSAAKEAIRRNENSAAYRHFMNECMKDKDFQKNGIADFLILPIQRVTRYVLLLQDLKKHTPSDHMDYPDIVAALEDMRNLANTVNEVKRREEEMTRMFYVVRSVEECPPTIISANRRVLFEVDTFEVTRNNARLALHPVEVAGTGFCVTPSVGSLGSALSADSNHKNDPSPIRLFIFSDLMLMAKPILKRKTDKFPFVSDSNANGEDKFHFFRMAWLKDVEIMSVDSSDEPGSSKKDASLSPGNRLGRQKDMSKKKHLVKVVIHNSEAGTTQGRRRLYRDLARANTTGAEIRRRAAAGSMDSPLVSPMTNGGDSSRPPKQAFFDTIPMHNFLVDDNKENMGVRKSLELPLPLQTILEGKNETSDPTEPKSPSPLREMMVMEESPIQEDTANASNTSHTPHADSFAADLLPFPDLTKRSLRPAVPRTTSLRSKTVPNIATLVEQMIVGQDDNLGVVTVTPCSAQPADPGSPAPSTGSRGRELPSRIQTQVEPTSSEGGDPKVNPQTPANSTATPTSNNTTTSNATSDEAPPNVTETFILEFTERKRKHELLLVVDRLIAEHKILPPRVFATRRNANDRK